MSRTSGTEDAGDDVSEGIGTAVMTGTTVAVSTSGTELARSPASDEPRGDASP